MTSSCKHPKVRIVAREEDTEFVECQDCGEVFDAEEFRDMAIEEKVVDYDDDVPIKPKKNSPSNNKSPSA
jgi:hypothetical protein